MAIGYGPLPAPLPAPSTLCPCGLPWTFFRLTDAEGRVVRRAMCFECGTGVPPALWREHRIADLFASVEISSWIVGATFSRVNPN
jgi:hypothetical protein